MLVPPLFCHALSQGTYQQNYFSQEKAWEAQIVHDAPGTFYCGFKIDWQVKIGLPDLPS
ncbi:deoxyribonuclease I, partial [Erwinia amylovora]|nr:deoxyribonuclease I [Erwinia amylovora]